MMKLAVIGDPIAHSLSPMVHGTALKTLGVSFAYEKVQVKKGELEPFLDYAKKAGLRGFNLTMPHKVDILPYLEAMDESAMRFQSVNTVVVKDGKFYGYNTDGPGYCQSLKRKGYDFSQSRVTILGAGGVVRTLALEAAYGGAKEILILNRTAEKAEVVCRMVKERVNASVSAKTMTDENLCAAAKGTDILIQATPLGMHGVEADFQDLSFLQSLPKDALVSDLIYNPLRTQMLMEAEKLGLATMNGLGMLIDQGLIADALYLEKDFDMNVVFDAVEKACIQEMN